MNSINLIGRLVADPNVKEYQPGKLMCKFRVAVNRPFNREVTDFFNVVAFGNQANTISQYFHKGEMIGITGAMHTNNYTDKQGNQRTGYEIALERFSFCGSSQSQSRRANYGNANNEEMYIDDDFSLLDDDDPVPF